MLAERRRKVIYSNPRGHLWANDSQKYGQRLMQSMGWKEGKGLGKNENGITQNVKANMKFDNQGLGYKRKLNDWIEENNVYEQILADLAQHHQPATCNAKQTSNLENKTTDRLHYRKKFIKAKNLSVKSKKDLYCIFPTNKLSQEQNDTNESLENDNANSKNNTIATEKSGDTTVTLITVKSKQSVEEYFRHKMQMKSKRLTSCDNNDDEIIQAYNTESGQHNNVTPTTEKTSSSKRKQKRLRNTACE